MVSFFSMSTLIFANRITPVTRHCSRSKRSTASTSGQTSFILPTRLCE
nr:MAG TPA_asm: hypothetical protein [Caudoviricetes sp.]